MNKERKPGRVPVGRITRPHGLKGELRVQPFLREAGLLTRIPVFYLGPRDPVERLHPVRVRQAPGGRDFLFFFREVETLEGAEALRGKTLYASLSDFPPPEEDEYYYFQLEGLEVRDEEGRVLGRVKGVMPVGPYDLLEVEDPKGRGFYLPMVEEVILRIDLPGGYILVRPLPGLIEAQIGP